MPPLAYFSTLKFREIYNFDIRPLTWRDLRKVAERKIGNMNCKSSKVARCRIIICLTHKQKFVATYINTYLTKIMYASLERVRPVFREITDNEPCLGIATATGSKRFAHEFKLTRYGYPGSDLMWNSVTSPGDHVNSKW